MTPAERHKKWLAKPGSLERKRAHSRKSDNKRRDKIRASKAANKDWQRNYDLKRAYGISLADFELMLQEQNGLCFVCHRPERLVIRGVLRPLGVDHNHQTGQVRKLLCHTCNTSIGLLDENPDRMRALASYIEQFNQTDNPAHL